MWVPCLDWEDPLENEMARKYSCLENSMDGGTWWATVHGVTKELDTTEHTCMRKCIFNFIKNFQIVQDGCMALHSHSHEWEFQLLRILVSIWFLPFSWVGGGLSLCIGIRLMANSPEHHFVCLLAIIYFLLWILFLTFAHLKKLSCLGASLVVHWLRNCFAI